METTRHDVALREKIRRALIEEVPEASEANVEKALNTPRHGSCDPEKEL
jgi:hypothetical protein